MTVCKVGSYAEGRRVDRVEERVGAVEGKIDTMNTRLIGVEGAIKELTAQHRWMSSFVDSTIDRHEQDISQLKARMAQVEARQEGH